MRRLLIGIMSAFLLALGAPAFAADGPAGTSEEGNQLDCGAPGDTDVDAGNGVMVKTEGDQAAPQDGGAVVVCNDGTDVPVQGRVMGAGGTEGGYVAADGDADNSPEQAQGWARVDVSPTGPAAGCGDTTTGDTDAANPAGALSTDTCG